MSKLNRMEGLVALGQKVILMASNDYDREAELREFVDNAIAAQLTHHETELLQTTNTRTVSKITKKMGRLRTPEFKEMAISRYKAVLWMVRAFLDFQGIFHRTTAARRRYISAFNYADRHRLMDHSVCVISVMTASVWTRNELRTKLEKLETLITARQTQVRE